MKRAYNNALAPSQVPLYQHEALQRKANEYSWVITELKSIIRTQEEKIIKLQKIITEQGEKQDAIPPNTIPIQ